MVTGPKENRGEVLMRERVLGASPVNNILFECTLQSRCKSGSKIIIIQCVTFGLVGGGLKVEDIDVKA